MTKFTAEEIEVAKSNGISLAALHQRIRKGWDKEQAITIPILNSIETARRGTEAAKKYRKSKRSNSWSARGVGIMVRCPVPGCEHTGNIITKAHCRLVHHMERDEVKKKYGMPYNVKVGVI